MTPPLVELADVGVRFGATPVLTGVSLQCRPGSVIGVAGPNGAGKTTLLGVIATLIRPTSGVGQVLGAALGTAETKTVRSRIGWSGHDPGLYPELTLGENLRFAATVAGTDPDRADASLAAVGLGGARGRRADRSSNGMQRRVDLAGLLMLQPDLLLLDEAHAGLDQAAEEIIDELLARTRRRGGAAILVSHDRHRLERQVDAVVRLEEGRTP